MKVCSLANWGLVQKCIHIFWGDGRSAEDPRQRFVIVVGPKFAELGVEAAGLTFRTSPEAYRSNFRRGLRARLEINQVEGLGLPSAHKLLGFAMVRTRVKIT